MIKLTKGKLKSTAAGLSAVAGKASTPPRSAPTTPLAMFERSIDRAQNLLTIHGMVHRTRSRPPLLLADVHRAVIVLAVSALDAYIRTLVVNKVLVAIKDIHTQIPSKLRDYLKGLITYDELLEAARIADLCTRVEKALKTKMEESSYQGVAKITEAMKLVGHDDIFKEVARAASINEQQLKEGVGRYTTRRHIVAHCGDYDLTQTPPTENPITKHEAEECIKLMTIVARKIDKVS